MHVQYIKIKTFNCKTSADGECLFDNLTMQAKVLNLHDKKMPNQT